MKTITILACLLALSNHQVLSAQVPKPKPVSKGYVGKSLPELRGSEGDASEWLGTETAVSLEKLRGEVVLVVLTSVP
ncbi:MAG: hypothetical protein KDB53_11930 [Planctomycetes bacterium]|nr:hypothetical protein [Planctomycetota bacterium]